jgi:RimJ/RimL family protein N-acetyltransferase
MSMALSGQYNYKVEHVELSDHSMLEIRPAVEDDATHIMAHLFLVGDESPFLSFSSDEINWTVDREKEIIAEHNTSENQLLVVGLVDENIVAVSNVHSTYKRRGRHMGELGISIAKAYWSKGIASAIMMYILNWAKQNTIVEKLTLEVLDSNTKAIALYEKFGFKREGVLKKASIVDGQYHDLIRMSIFV